MANLTVHQRKIIKELINHLASYIVIMEYEKPDSELMGVVIAALSVYDFNSLDTVEDFDKLYMALTIGYQLDEVNFDNLDESAQHVHWMLRAIFFPNRCDEYRVDTLEQALDKIPNLEITAEVKKIALTTLKAIIHLNSLPASTYERITHYEFHTQLPNTKTRMFVFHLENYKPLGGILACRETAVRLYNSMLFAWNRSAESNTLSAFLQDLEDYVCIEGSTRKSLRNAALRLFTQAHGSLNFNDAISLFARQAECLLGIVDFQYTPAALHKIILTAYDGVACLPTTSGSQRTEMIQNGNLKAYLSNLGVTNHYYFSDDASTAVKLPRNLSLLFSQRYISAILTISTAETELKLQQMHAAIDEICRTIFNTNTLNLPRMLTHIRSHQLFFMPFYTGGNLFDYSIEKGLKNFICELGELALLLAPTCDVSDLIYLSRQFMIITCLWDKMPKLLDVILDRIATTRTALRENTLARSNDLPDLVNLIQCLSWDTYPEIFLFFAREGKWVYLLRKLFEFQNNTYLDALVTGLTKPLEIETRHYFNLHFNITFLSELVKHPKGRDFLLELILHLEVFPAAINHVNLLKPVYSENENEAAWTFPLEHIPKSSALFANMVQHDVGTYTSPEAAHLEMKVEPGASLSKVYAIQIDMWIVKLLAVAGISSDVRSHMIHSFLLEIIPARLNKKTLELEEYFLEMRNERHVRQVAQNKLQMIDELLNFFQNNILSVLKNLMRAKLQMTGLSNTNKDFLKEEIKELANIGDALYFSYTNAGLELTYDLLAYPDIVKGVSFHHWLRTWETDANSAPPLLLFLQICQGTIPSMVPAFFLKQTQFVKKIPEKYWYIPYPIGNHTLYTMLQIFFSNDAMITIFKAILEANPTLAKTLPLAVWMMKIPDSLAVMSENLTYLEQLANSEAGCTVILRLIEHNPEIFPYIAEHLTFEFDANKNYIGSTLLHRLSKNSEGRVLFNRLIRAPEFLSKVPMILWPHSLLLQPGTPLFPGLLHGLLDCDDGFKTFSLIFERRPTILVKMPIQKWFETKIINQTVHFPLFSRMLDRDTKTIIKIFQFIIANHVSILLHLDPLYFFGTPSSVDSPFIKMVNRTDLHVFLLKILQLNSSLRNYMDPNLLNRTSNSRTVLALLSENISVSRRLFDLLRSNKKIRKLLPKDTAKIGAIPMDNMYFTISPLHATPGAPQRESKGSSSDDGVDFNSIEFCINTLDSIWENNKDIKATELKKLLLDKFVDIVSIHFKEAESKSQLLTSIQSEVSNEEPNAIRFMQARRKPLLSWLKRKQAAKFVVLEEEKEPAKSYTLMVGKIRS